MNIVVNVVDYMLERGEICVNVLCIDNVFSIVVFDSGSGFLQEVLKKVIQFFYMEDKSRYLVGYYGMGFIFVYYVVYFYYGELIFENKKFGGVWVEI